MTVQSLSNTTHRALNGISNALDQVDATAQNVASSGANDSPDRATEMSAELTKLPTQRLHARANARVVEAADDLFKEISALPR